MAYNSYTAPRASLFPSICRIYTARDKDWETIVVFVAIMTYVLTTGRDATQANIFCMFPGIT